MGTTSPDSLPYPGDGDPPDGPGQLSALATAVQTALTARTTAINGKAATSHTHDSYALGFVDSQTGSDVTSTTSPSAYTASKAVTLTSGRRYKVSAKWKFRNSSGTNTGCGADIKFYAGAAGSTLAQVAPQYVEGNALSQQEYGTMWFLYTGSGSETFRMLIERTSANGIATLEDVSWILEDLGDV